MKKNEVSFTQKLARYLQDVHDIDLSDIDPDPSLSKLLSRLRRRPWIFTASTAEWLG